MYFSLPRARGWISWPFKWSFEVPSSFSFLGFCENSNLKVDLGSPFLCGTGLKLTLVLFRIRRISKDVFPTLVASASGWPTGKCAYCSALLSGGFAYGCLKPVWWVQSPNYFPSFSFTDIFLHILGLKGLLWHSHLASCLVQTRDLTQRFLWLVSELLKCIC